MRLLPWRWHCHRPRAAGTAVVPEQVRVPPHPPPTPLAPVRNVQDPRAISTVNDHTTNMVCAGKPNHKRTTNEPQTDHQSLPQRPQFARCPSALFPVVQSQTQYCAGATPYTQFLTLETRNRRAYRPRADRPRVSRGVRAIAALAILRRVARPWRVVCPRRSYRWAGDRQRGSL